MFSSSSTMLACRHDRGRLLHDERSVLVVVRLIAGVRDAASFDERRP
jgi:hypothetical protein